MGNSRYSDKDWHVYSTATSAKSREQIFTARVMDPALDPSKFAFREAVDSDANPNATPIILASDVTGSMGILAETIVKKGLGKILKELYDRKPVTDPQILCAAIGDAYYDMAPFQVTQFEASTTPLTAQIEKIYLEAGGGGNAGESYALAWYFAAFKTKCDAITKRHRKGYVFTIGDECAVPLHKRDQIHTFLGDHVSTDVKTDELLALVQRNWHVFHLIVKPVAHQPVVKDWKELLGQRAIVVDDIERLAEGIVALIQVCEGMEPGTVAAGWKGDPAHAVVERVTAQLVAAS